MEDVDSRRLCFVRNAMDESEEFSKVLHDALGIIASQVSAGSCSALGDFVVHCREFQSGETIQDYPDWLEQLGSLARTASQAEGRSSFGDAAISLSELIENLSYGAIEQVHVDSALEVVATLRAT